MPHVNEENSRPLYVVVAGTAVASVGLSVVSVSPFQRSPSQQHSICDRVYSLHASNGFYQTWRLLHQLAGSNQVLNLVAEKLIADEAHSL